MKKNADRNIRDFKNVATYDRFKATTSHGHTLTPARGGMFWSLAEMEFFESSFLVLAKYICVLCLKLMAPFAKTSTSIYDFFLNILKGFLMIFQGWIRIRKGVGGVITEEELTQKLLLQHSIWHNTKCLAFWSLPNCFCLLFCLFKQSVAMEWVSSNDDSGWVSLRRTVWRHFVKCGISCLNIGHFWGDFFLPVASFAFHFDLFFNVLIHFGMLLGNNSQINAI